MPDTGRVIRTADVEGAEVSLPPGFHKRIHEQGRRVQPTRMSAAEKARLKDPVAQLVLGRGQLPRDLPSFLAAIDEHAATPDAMPVQKVYVADEGGQLTPGSGVPQNPRFVVTRSKTEPSASDPFAETNLLVSTNAVGDVQFLQAIGWDDENGTFNFYELQGMSWLWAGNSEHAMHPPTRGAAPGPFDSHINGTLVMKELRFPWVHWHSEVAEAPFPDALLDGNVLDPIGGPGPIADAARLETQVVMPAIIRSVQVRLERIAAEGTIQEPELLLRHVFEGTTVNLASSVLKTRDARRGQPVPLPDGFFVASDLVKDQRIGLAQLAFESAARGEDYLDALRDHRVALRTGSFEQDGDTFFAFVVPTRAFEDDEVALQMVERGWLSERFVVAAMLVDFPNPVFSSRRAGLMKFVPGPVAPTGPDGLEEGLVSAILAAADSDPAAAGFAATWQAADFEQHATDLITPYADAVATKLQTREGYEDIFRLAESRRREFANQKLREFDLTLATTPLNIPAPLEMTPSGVVQPRA